MLSSYFFFLIYWPYSPKCPLSNLSRNTEQKIPAFLRIYFTCFRAATVQHTKDLPSLHENLLFNLVSYSVLRSRVVLTSLGLKLPVCSPLTCVFPNAQAVVFAATEAVRRETRRAVIPVMMGGVYAENTEGNCLQEMDVLLWRQQEKLSLSPRSRDWLEIAQEESHLAR